LTLHQNRDTLSAMEFLGREAEPAALEAAYASAQIAFFPIYGRRRVG
jgi:AAA+ ATPase superfamily predicted ATPase